ncbi:DUF927 domain-containing protein [Pseudoroseomonas sp. WGS1072]|uniref:DUF927 domain-containing protein n=1 Tax=Roseomonas sp. WGS1072 TaxID=3366816 RepID=UPI003BF00662
MSDEKPGKSRIKAAIAEAKPAVSTALSSNVVPMPSFGRHFRVDTEGIWKPSSDPDKAATWVCAPLEVVAETRSTEGLSWGLLLRFSDRDGVEKEVIVPRRLLAGDGAAVRELLADAGLVLGASQAARVALLELLTGARSPTRATSVPCGGWHRVGGRMVFVLPNLAIGATGDHVFIDQAARAPHAFQQQGTLDDWKQNVAALCIGNSRLAFSVSCALAGPLLQLAAVDGAGFNLKGASRLGKSTALRLAASVWGGDPATGASAFIKTWRTTSNGVESTAAAHSDTLLVLDELGQLDGREAGEAAYMLANGKGKVRASRNGLARPELRWRAMILSSGEVGIAEKSEEAGKIMRAGQEVRLIDIEADAGAKLGLFENIHAHTSPADFAEHITAATTAQFGSAAPAWLTWLVGRLAEDEEGFRTNLIRRRGEAAKRMLPAGAGGQVASVAALFALVGVAGELAAEAGVLPWPETEAEDAAFRCFGAWIRDRGGIGAREDQQAETQLRRFIQLHGPGRFQLWGKAPEDAQDDPDAHPDTPPHERFRTVNRAGFRRWEPVQEGKGTRWRWVYYATSTGMNEALVGLQFRQSVASLTERGFLVSDQNGRSSQSLRPTGEPKQRLYVIADKLFSEDEADL